MRYEKRFEYRGFYNENAHWTYMLGDEHIFVFNHRLGRVRYFVVTPELKYLITGDRP